MPEQA